MRFRRYAFDVACGMWNAFACFRRSGRLCFVTQSRTHHLVHKWSPQQTQFSRTVQKCRHKSDAILIWDVCPLTKDSALLTYIPLAYFLNGQSAGAGCYPQATAKRSRALFVTAQQQRAAKRYEDLSAGKYRPQVRDAANVKLELDKGIERQNIIVAAIKEMAEEKPERKYLLERVLMHAIATSD